MTKETSNKRRWLQFRLRTMLLVVTAMGVWLGLQIHSARRQKQAALAITQAGRGWCYYDFQNYDPMRATLDPAAKPWEPAWLQSLVGLDFFHNIVGVNMYVGTDSETAETLEPDFDFVPDLQAFPHLRSLCMVTVPLMRVDAKDIGRMTKLEYLFILDAQSLSDSDVAQFANLRRLRQLSINNADISDESLRILAGLPQIEFLAIQGNEISDEGLKYLPGMTNLRHLWIGRGMGITDNGMAHVAQLTGLESLDLQSSQVTTKGIEQLKSLTKLSILCVAYTRMDNSSELNRILPDCRIYMESMSAPARQIP